MRARSTCCCLFNVLKYTHPPPLPSSLSLLPLNSIKNIMNIEYCSVFLIKDSIDGQSKELISNVTTKDSTKREIRVKLGSGIAGTMRGNYYTYIYTIHTPLHTSKHPIYTLYIHPIYTNLGTVGKTGRMILVKVNRLICIALCADLCYAVLCCVVLCCALN